MVLDFITIVQRYVATTTIGSSTLRNQGGSGVIDCARTYLINFDLSHFAKIPPDTFSSTLDKETDSLASSFPVEGKAWGTARKALNLFLREALYNTYLCEKYELHRIEDLLEVPLDSKVVEGLKRTAERGGLPSWPGLKHLKKKVSDTYQAYALILAGDLGIARVHLDPYLWVENR